MIELIYSFIHSILIGFCCYPFNFLIIALIMILTIWIIRKQNTRFISLNKKIGKIKTTHKNRVRSIRIVNINEFESVIGYDHVP